MLEKPTLPDVTEQDFWTAERSFMACMDADAGVFPYFDPLHNGQQQMDHVLKAQTRDLVVKYSRNNDLAKFAILFSATMIVVHRHTAKRSLCVHTLPLRSRPEANSLTPQVVPFIFSIDPQESIRQYLQRFQKKMSDVFNNMNSLSGDSIIPQGDILVYSNRLSDPGDEQLLKRYRAAFDFEIANSLRLTLTSGPSPNAAFLSQLAREVDEVLMQYANLETSIGNLRLEPGEERSAPVTAMPSPLEAKLLSIWSKVLPAADIRMDDNFFEIGGHSLKAMQLVSMIEEEMGVTLELRTLFTHPTVHTLATQLDTLPLNRSSSIPALPAGESYELSHSQQSMWILDKVGGAKRAYNINSCFSMTGSLVVEALQKAFLQVVKRHEALRTIFRTIDGQPRQVITPALNFKDVLHFSDMSDLADKEAAVRLMLEEKMNVVFDLEAGPLFRFDLVKQAAGEYILCMVFHHIIFDAWSLEVFIAEAMRFYKAFRDRKAVDIQPLDIQYKDYAAWHNAYIRSGKADEVRGYWRRRFEGVTPFFGLSGDITSPDSRRKDAGIFRYSLSKFKKDSVSRLCVGEEVSSFMFYLAALKVLLFKYSGMPHIIVGTPVAGRSAHQLQKQIGLFLNSVPLYSKVRQDLTFLEYLKDVRQAVMEAHESQIYPFDLLTEDFRSKQVSGRQPFFEIMVDMLHENILKETQTAEIEDVLIRGYPTGETDQCKYDLTIYLKEGQGLSMDFEYNKHMYTEHFVKRFSERYELLLNTVLEDPGVSISNLNLENRIQLPRLKKTVK